MTVEYDWDLNAGLPLLALEREQDGTLLHRYTYGLELTSITGTQGTAYYRHDRLGSPRLLTSETGAPQAAYRYEPFGVPRYAADATAPPNPMLLNGNNPLRYVDPRGLAAERLPDTATDDGPLERCLTAGFLGAIGGAATGAIAGAFTGPGVVASAGIGALGGFVGGCLYALLEPIVNDLMDRLFDLFE